MFKHLFTGIYRNFLRDKLSTILNLTNLVIGFTVFTLLSLIVNYEFNYDKFNKNSDHIYKVQTRQDDSYPTNFCTYSPSAYRYHLMSDLPEVEKVLLMGETSGQYFTLPDGNQLYDKYGYWCENSIFDIFTIHLNEGDKNSALTEPYTILLSETLSDKLFPNGNANGKQVVVDKRIPLTVTGVYSDFKPNSTLQASYLISLPTYSALNTNSDFRDNWTSINWDNFVLLKKGADPTLVNAKIKDAFKDVKNFEKSSPYLHPLAKWHISPNNQSDLIIGLSILSFAAILILVLSCVNYVNLSLASSSRRAREIGIKKVIGSSKKMLALQFLFETIILTVTSVVIGLFLAQTISPIVGQLFQTKMNLNVFSEGRLLFIVISVSLLAGIISGLYPSFILSSFNPVKVLKGKFFQNSAKKISLKKVLVTSQFSITVFMLVVSFILTSHVDFILNKSLGFKSNEILISEINFNEKIPFSTVRNRLLQHPEIADACFSSTVPFEGNIGGYVTWDGAQPEEKVMISRNYVNYDFIPTYGLQMVYGRNFSKDHPSDKRGCIINETAMKAFGWSNPDEKQIYFYDRAIPVIGVVKDFHPFSVHNSIPPYLMFLNSDIAEGTQKVTVRYLHGNEQKAKEIINSELETVIPNDAFEFKDFSHLFYLDDAIKFWQSMKKIFIFFSILTILVSSMGLLGLMIFSIQRRTKEIGVRKVMGSSVFELYQQLSSEILILLVSSLVFAFPAAIYVYKTMPGSYKEPLSVIDFTVAFSIVAVITILTISYHVIKLSVGNPVNALKYE